MYFEPATCYLNQKSDALFIYLYQARRAINIINTNRKRQTDTDNADRQTLKQYRKNMETVNTITLMQATKPPCNAGNISNNKVQL